MGHTRVYSFWEKSHFFDEIDFVIVGAGIVGLGNVYFRIYRNRVLLGCARNLDLEGEQTEEYGSNDSISDYLLSFLSETILPDIPFKIAHSWSGIIAIGESKKPIIKKISENVFLGVRMGGMGVAIGSLVGKQLSELVE